MEELVYCEYDIESDMFSFDDKFYRLYGSQKRRRNKIQDKI
ncbi:MAG TPA: hypothetical protein VHO92_06510 [Methanobacterium sp.]|nr:hypothetical protein [Methanobacterium sp.]